MALNFPAKIYQILENESSDIIKWLPNGAAFRIVDHGRFEREIIPKYFRHNQLSSVQRQLNLYGFKCISRGEDKGAFYHSKFRRGDWEVVKKITRYAPIKRADDKNDDPTRPDDELILALDSSKPPQSAPTPTSSATAHRPAENSNFHSHMSPPFQPYPNVYRHYDPFGFSDLSYRQPAHSAESANHSSMYPNSPPPPAWMWGGPSAMPYAATPYAMHMKQMIESTPEFREFQQMKQDATKTTSTQSSQAASSQSSTTSEKSTPVPAPQPAKLPEPSLPVNPPVAAASVPAPELKKTTSFTHIEKPSAYVNVVNDSVFIDPDFDLDEEFYFLHELNDNTSVPAHLAQSKTIADAMESQPPKTCDVGVNTDISLLWNYNDL